MFLLYFSYPADHAPDWQPRILLGTVEARSVNVEYTTTTTTISYICDSMSKRWVVTYRWYFYCLLLSYFSSSTVVLYYCTVVYRDLVFDNLQLQYCHPLTL